MDPLDATNATEPIVDTTFDVYGLINVQPVRVGADPHMR